MLSIAPEKLSAIETNELKTLPMENTIGAPIKQELMPDIQSASTSPRKDTKMPRARNRGPVNLLQAVQKELVKEHKEAMKEALDLGKENEDAIEESKEESAPKEAVSSGKTGPKTRGKK